METDNETQKTLQELKVSELKTELEKRGLDKNGIKSALIERLEQALKTEGLDAQSHQFNVQEISVTSPKKALRSSVMQDGSEVAQQIRGGAELEEEVQKEQQRREFETREDSFVIYSPSVGEEQNGSADLPKEQQQPESVVSEAMTGEKGSAALNLESDCKASTPKMELPEPNGKTKEEEKGSITAVEGVEEKQEADVYPNKSPNEGTEAVLIVESPKRGIKREETEPEIIIEEPSSGGSGKPKTTTEEAKAKAETKQKAAANGKQTAPASKQSSPKKSASAAGGNLAASLWIRNIANTTKAADLKALLSKHGKVVTAKIFTTKNKQSPTCFGYVTLADVETADLCVHKLNRSNFKGRIINVEKADRSNLSQFDKNAAAPSQQNTEQPRNAAEGTEGGGIKSGKDGDAGVVSSNNGAKRSTRPRITAAIQSPKAGTSSEKRQIINKSSYQPRDRYVGGGGRGASHGGVERAIKTFARRDYAAKLPVRESQQMLRRVVHQTSRGIRISTSVAPYGHRAVHAAPVEMAPRRDFNSYHSREMMDSRGAMVPDDSRDEMMRMMRRREEEHRKKEEELRLEKERERLKYEREKLERERLELEHMKLAAQIAQAAQYQFMPAAISGQITAAAALNQSHQIHHPQHMESGRSSAKKDASSASHNKSSTTSSSKRPSSRSKDVGHSSSSQRHSSRNRVSSRDRHPPGGNSSVRRDRSRSPMRRSSTSANAPPSRDKADTIMSRRSGGRDWSQQGKGDRDTRPNYGTTSSYQMGGGSSSFANSQARGSYSQKQPYPSAGGGGFNRNAADRREGTHGRPVESSNRDYCGTGGQHDRYEVTSTSGPDFAASRTDPSYAQRVGQQHYSLGRPDANAMYGGGASGGGGFANIGFPGAQQQFRHDQQFGGGSQQQGSFYNQPPQQQSQWAAGGDRGGVDGSRSSSSYINSSGGGWNRQAENIMQGGFVQEWNMYGRSSPQKQGGGSSSALASSGGRFQPTSSSYGGGKSGGSSMYQSEGGGSRRF